MLVHKTLQSNAKINIGLNVINKKSNGYHEIESLIQEISLYDNIEIKIFKEKGKTEVISSGININCDLENNTCYKIVELIKCIYKIHNKIWVRVNKKIKIGSGLGGADRANFLIKGMDVKPEAVKRSGFKFEYETVGKALEALLG